MTAGRTSWWPKDAAWHRRERIVELGEEFGPAGAMVMDVLSAWAQEQRAAGRVRGGFRSLAREAFIGQDLDLVRRILDFAAELGALDDLEHDPDGRRFSCRVSGWQADSDRGRAALRKASQRSGCDPDDPAPDDDPEPIGATVDPSVSGRSEGGHVTPAADVVTFERDKSGSVPLNRTDHRRTTTEKPFVEASPDEDTHPSTAQQPDGDTPTVDPGPDARRLCQLLAELICERDPRARSRVKPDSKRWLDSMRLLIADRDGDVAEVERVLRWSQADEFWRGNILSPSKLREKFVQLRERANGRPAGRRIAAVDTSRRLITPPAPCPGVNADAAAVFNPIREAVQHAVPQTMWEAWLQPLHAHHLDGNTLVLGCPPQRRAWVENRFKNVLERHGYAIRFVDCDGPQQQRSAA